LTFAGPSACFDAVFVSLVVGLRPGQFLFLLFFFVNSLRRETWLNMPPPISQVILAVMNPRVHDERGHVEYEVQCATSEVLPGEILARPIRWSAWRRFREFEQLHAALLRQYGHAVAEVRFPPKRLVGAADPQFVVERCAQLHEYLAHVTAVCHGCTRFGEGHLESAALRKFMLFDERIALARALPKALMPPPNAAPPPPPRVPAAGLWGSLFGFTVANPAAEGAAGAAAWQQPAPAPAPAPAAKAGAPAPAPAAGAAAPPSAASPAASTGAPAQTPPSPTTAATRAASMRRQQSRSAIVGSYSNSGAAALPAAAAPLVAPKAFAPLPAALPSSSGAGSAPAPPSLAPAPAPAVAAPRPAAPAPAPAVAPAPMGGPPRPPGAPAAAPMGGPPRPPGAPAAVPPGAGPPRPPAPPASPAGPPRPPGAPSAPASVPAPPPGAPDRSGMLSDISAGGFKLKKAVTVDKSKPKL